MNTSKLFWWWDVVWHRFPSVCRQLCLSLPAYGGTLYTQAARCEPEQPPRSLPRVRQTNEFSRCDTFLFLLFLMALFNYFSGFSTSAVDTKSECKASRSASPCHVQGSQPPGCAPKFNTPPSPLRATPAAQVCFSHPSLLPRVAAFLSTVARPIHSIFAA